MQRELDAQEIEFQNAQQEERMRFVEEERIRRARNEADAQIMQAEIITKEKKETGRSVGKTTFVMMLTVAIFCDVFISLISLIPYIGWIINWLASFVIFLTFFVWFKTKGIKYTSARKMAALPAGFLIEMIPYVNLLPGWTVAVILNTQVDKLPGLKA